MPKQFGNTNNSKISIDYEIDATLENIWDSECAVQTKSAKASNFKNWSMNVSTTNKSKIPEYSINMRKGGKHLVKTSDNKYVRCGDKSIEELKQTFNVSWVQDDE